MKAGRVLAITAMVLTVVGIVGTRNEEKPISETKTEITERENEAKQPRSVTITATGDCTFATDINAVRELGFDAYAEKYGNEWFFKNVEDIFAEDDLTIVNFEGTLSDRGEREIKQFAFRGNPDYVNILSQSSVEAANLANNHSMDYGMVSLEDTKLHLDNAGILHCRGEEDVTITEINGIKIGLVGINYLNDQMKTELEAAIKKAKDEGAELVILSIHWGVEKATSPNSEQIKAAHTAIDCGADLVIGNHPHVLQGLEKYNGRYICYSLGNFSFGGNNSPSDTDTALFRITLTIDNGELLDDGCFEIIPCSISSAEGYNNYQPTPAVGDKKARIEKKLTEYTNALGGPELNFR